MDSTTKQGIWIVIQGVRSEYVIGDTNSRRRQIHCLYKAKDYPAPHKREKNSSENNSVNKWKVAIQKITAKASLLMGIQE